MTWQIVDTKVYGGRAWRDVRQGDSYPYWRVDATLPYPRNREALLLMSVMFLEQCTPDGPWRVRERVPVQVILLGLPIIFLAYTLSGHAGPPQVEARGVFRDGEEAVSEPSPFSNESMAQMIFEWMEAGFNHGDFHQRNYELQDMVSHAYNTLTERAIRNEESLAQDEAD